jgi:hypothetical protein
MVRKIFLVIAILGGLAAGGLNFAMIKDKIVGLQKNLADETAAKNTALADLSKTKKDLTASQAELKTTKDTLATTSQERDTAVQEAAAAVKKADSLTTQLKDTKKTLEDTASELAAFRATSFTPVQITGFGKEIKGLNAHITAVEQENAIVMREKERLQNRLNVYEGEGTNIVYLDPSIRGKVTASDPKWNFVVLDVGSDQHALELGELLVNRNSKLVAKVVITSVQKDRCVANIVPGWELGEVMEGDVVIPAHPKSL